MSWFLGIDPGLHGAIAAYNVDLGVLAVADIPTHKITTNGKERLHLDRHGLAALLRAQQREVVLAIIEDVHFIPIRKKNGEQAQVGVSAFKFGFVAGAIQQCVADHNIPMKLVAPQIWKRRFGLKADKDAARAKASELLPAHAHLWARKCDDGRAEAALLAYYGAKFGS